MRRSWRATSRATTCGDRADGLEQTPCSYRLLVGLFNMPGDDTSASGLPKQHDCHLPFQRFRMARSAAAVDPRDRPEAYSA
jgi:hypothetical protein